MKLSTLWAIFMTIVVFELCVVVRQHSLALKQIHPVSMVNRLAVEEP